MRTRDRAALVLVAIAVTFGCLALGGAPRWAACTAALAAIASAIPFVTSQRTATSISRLLLLPAAAVLFTAIQLVPLPVAIAELVAPSKLALVRDNAAAWNDPAPSWVFASYDPPATLVELAKYCGYLVLAWTCVRLSANRRARRWLAMIAAGVPGLVAFVTLAHLAVGATALYGFVDPGFRPRLLGPLFGVNHLASLMSIAVPVAAALGLTARGLPRLGWFLVAAATAGVAMLTGSRGGVVGLIAALVVAAALVLIQRRGETKSLAVSLPAGIIAGCVVVLLAAFTAGTVARELQRTTLDELQDPRSKYQVWGDAMPLVTENAWLGIGRGAFEPAFTPYSPTSFSTYGYAENTYLQILLDWGIPAALVLGFLLVAATATAAKRWRKGPIEAAVIGSLAGLAVHEIADFSLEVPAVAMIAIVSASILFPERLAFAGKDGTRTSPKIIGPRVALLTAAVAVVALALSPLGRTARRDEAAIASAKELPATIERARAASARHPADYAILARGAAALERADDGRALSVVRRALSRNPRHSAIHRLAARMLVRANALHNAAAEFALAIRHARDPRPIVADVLQVYASPQEAARALPTDIERLDLVHRALNEHPEVASAHLARVAVLHPSHPRPHEMLASVALTGGNAAQAVKSAERAWELEPTPARARLVGRSLVATGDTPRALTFLRAAADQFAATPASERVPLLVTLADTHLDAGDPAEAKRVLESARSSAQPFRHLRILLHVRMATVEEKLGNAHQAQWERDRARELGQR